MVRILFLTSTFEPLTGGAETYGRLLTTALVAAGHEVTVVTDGSWVEDRPDDTTENGCRVLRLHRFSKEVGRRDKVVWRQMQYALLNELGDILTGETFDIVHANSHEALQLGLPVAEDMRAALVASLHEQNPDLEAYGRGRCRLVYSLLPVDMHIAASRFYWDRAIRYGANPSRLQLVYHGVNPTVAAGDRERALARFDLPQGAPIVTCPGRLYERKGQAYLAEAFARIRTTHPTAHLLLAGRVSDFDYARNVFDRLGQLVDDGAVSHFEELTSMFHRAGEWGKPAWLPAFGC